MKRRCISLLLSILFMLGLSSTTIQASDWVYFTAVDVNMLEVTDETMPFWSGGYLYVDSRIFSNLTLEYGTLYHSYNISKQALALYTSKNVRSLVFYLDTGTTVDGEGRAYHAQAIVKGDVVFLPIVIVANFFELRYSTISVNHGTLVRLTVDQDPILSDTAFVDAAASWIEVRYNEYIKSKTTTTTTTPETSTPETTAPQEGVVVQLAFTVGEDSPVQDWLSLLDGADGQASFFFTAQSIQEQGDLLRQILAQGHTIGLMVDDTLDLDPLDQLSQANQTLYQATTTVSQLVWGIDEQTQEAATTAGYCLLTTHIDVSEDGLLTSNGASIVKAQINRNTTVVTVWLGDKTTKAGLSSLIDYCHLDNDHFHNITLLSAQF